MNFCILWWIWPGGNFERNEWNILTCLRHLLAWQMDYIIFLLSDSFVFSCIYCIYFFSALLVMSLIDLLSWTWLIFLVSHLFIYSSHKNILTKASVFLYFSLICLYCFFKYHMLWWHMVTNFFRLCPILFGILFIIFKW